MVAKNRKPSMGRQKIEIKRITSEEARQVCFSKRRSGLFNKANELSILCGAELTILSFSPGGKPYSNSHPSFDLIANRFLYGHDHHQASSSTAIVTIADQQSSSNVQGDLNRRYESCLQILGVERKRKVSLEILLKSASFTDENLDKMDFGQLDLMEKNMYSLKIQVQNILMDYGSSFGQRQQYVSGNMMQLSNVIAGNGYADMGGFNQGHNMNYSYQFGFPPLFYEHKHGFQF